MGLSSYRLNAFIAVTDMTRAEEFYEGKLGLPVVRTGADGSKVYASGGGESLVVYPSPDHAGRSTATLVTWYVDDDELVVDELTSNGVTFEQYEGVSRAASITGPTRRGSHPALAAAESPGSRIPTGTSSRSRVIVNTTWPTSLSTSRSRRPASRRGLRRLPAGRACVARV
jgi:catechol 2,3-dioxygenase-like lactoylglutathione lyase family enzyme